MIVRVVGTGYLFFREADSFNKSINFAPSALDAENLRRLLKRYVSW
jgi:hypothetical protein